MSHSRRIAPVALALLFTATAFAAPVKHAPTQPGTLTTEKDKVSYAIGMQIGVQIANSLAQVKNDVDPAIVLRAVTTVVNGGQPQMSIPEAQATLKAFGQKVQAREAAKQKVTAQADAAAAKQNLAEGAAFLAANAKKPGVKTTPSGLQYQVLQAGKGPSPKATDSVKANYTGSTLDGKVFDSSSQHGGPMGFQVNGVIPGWTEGLQLMNVGSKFVFWIPGKLAYGEKGAGGPIGPNATLKFEVELVSIGK